MLVAFRVHVKKRCVKVLVGRVVHPQHERSDSWLVADHIARQSLIDLAVAADNPVSSPTGIDEANVQIWKARYNADPTLIGRTLRINGVPTIVIGVMPDGLGFPVISDVWQPLGLLPGLANQTRDARELQVFGRLADRRTSAQAQSEVDAIAARLDGLPDHALQLSGCALTGSVLPGAPAACWHQSQSPGWP